MAVCANAPLALSLSVTIYRSQLSLILEDHASKYIDIEEEIHS